MCFVELIFKKMCKAFKFKFREKAPDLLETTLEKHGKLKFLNFTSSRNLVTHYMRTWLAQL